MVTETSQIWKRSFKYFYNSDFQRARHLSWKSCSNSVFQCAIFCLGELFWGLFFIVVFSYGRNADISSSSNVVPEENKSFTDKGGNQS